MCFYLIRPIQITSVIANRIFGPNKKKIIVPAPKHFSSRTLKNERTQAVNLASAVFPRRFHRSFPPLFSINLVVGHPLIIYD